MQEYSLLLVEDDEELAELIQDYLQTMEFKVDIENDGAKAMARIINEQPDIVLLDLMLPGMDGISICKQVRSQFHNLIVMLTASNETMDHVLGLEIGADEYLNKPIEPRILLAHLRALLRRQQRTNQAAPNQTLRVGNILLDPSNRKLTVNNQPVELALQEYELLHLLMEQQGAILSRDEIFKQLKGIEYDGENRFIDILVSQLRSKLAVDRESHKHIKTVRSKGYLFAREF